MNINRYNYEEFFLLYVDNELTKAERAEVEAFVHDNPDLEEELVMLRQTTLRPDAAITFQGKQDLLKPENAGFINETNYEEFFILYVDGELPPAARREVEAFAATQPHLQQELNLLQQTKLEPEQEVVFPDKSVLYKQPEKERPIIFMAWQRAVAVAAMILLALGIFWVMNAGKQDKPDAVAKTGDKQQLQNAKQPNVAKNSAGETAGYVADQVKTDLAQDQSGANKQNKSNRPVNSTRYNEPVNNDKQLAYEPQKVDQPGNTGSEPEKTLAAVDLVSVENNAGINRTTGLNVNAAQTSRPLIQTVAYAPVQEEENENVYIANTTVNRSKLRGLVRKVTRVFEKTTNLPAVEEKGILIGNLEVTLK